MELSALAGNGPLKTQISLQEEGRGLSHADVAGQARRHGSTSSEGECAGGMHALPFLVGVTVVTTVGAV